MKTKKMILAMVLSVAILIVAQMASQLIGSVFVVVGLPEFVCNIVAGILYIAFAYGLIAVLCKNISKMICAIIGYQSSR